MSNFPFDVLSDILCCVPVESLLRFRSLSKPCCSLIDDPDFIKLHLDRSIKTGSNGLFVYRNENESIQLVDINSPSAFPIEQNYSLVPRSIIDPNSNTRYKLRYMGVFGCCNGLIAIKHEDPCFTLYNPATRKHIWIPCKCQDCDRDLDCVLRKHDCYGSAADGFGYDATSDDYKIIMFVRQRLASDKATMVYSLKANSWRRIDDFLDVHFLGICSGELFGASLHWIVQGISDSKESKQLAAFDLGDEKLRLVPLPDSLSESSGMFSVVTLGGCLCIHFKNYSGRGHETVWMMKEYGVKESWTELCHIPPLWTGEEEPDFVDHSMKYTGYSRVGNRVLLGTLERFLYWYNLENQKFETSKIICLPYDFNEFRESSRYCIKSLVPLT